MRMFHLNIFSFILLLCLLSLLLVVPSIVIESLWNGFYQNFLERDLTISLWQAFLLWGACLSLLYMSGILKLKINFKTLDSIDLDNIEDPELRKELEKLIYQAKAKEPSQENVVSPEKITNNNDKD